MQTGGISLPLHNLLNLGTRRSRPVFLIQQVIALGGLAGPHRRSLNISLDAGECRALSKNCSTSVIVCETRITAAPASRSAWSLR